MESLSLSVGEPRTLNLIHSRVGSVVQLSLTYVLNNSSVTSESLLNTVNLVFKKHQLTSDLEDVSLKASSLLD